MKVNELWLRRWVNPELSSAAIAEKLTMAGLEVDALAPAAGDFTGVVIAKVINTTPHPEADRLTLCDVSINEDESKILKIVCGASNVRPNLVVALATIGAKLPNGLIIKETKLRGQLSQGMLCSTSELGLSESSEGILELDASAPIGQDIRDYLFLNDQVFDIDLTPNRADCLSVIGIARELSALTGSPLNIQPTYINTPVHDEKIDVIVDEPKACPHYCGRLITSINAAARTPLWIEECLRRAGIRSINALVDITNYVMLELGQPLHAFDAARVAGSIHVRRATNKEQLVLLDGQTVELNPKILLIADEQKPLAVAGVMGGQTSAVSLDTQNVFLESAFFNAVDIIGVARSLGLSTDAAQRFERGVDPNLAQYALEYATTLIIEVCGGQAGPISVHKDANYNFESTTIQFNPNKVKQLTGLAINTEFMLTCLQHLGFGVDVSQSIWQVTVPTYRVDIHLDVDLVEEIIRLYGYDKLSEAEPQFFNLKRGTICAVETTSELLTRFFVSRAYHETISYSFVDPDFQQEIYPDSQKLKLLNPISSELSEMRTGLWPGLLASMIHNLHRQQSAIKLFEIGVVFDSQVDQLAEHAAVAGLITGDKGAFNWCELTQKFDFYDVKGDLEALFQQLAVQNIKFVPAEHSALHPGKTASIQLNGELIGWCGVLHPRYADELDIVNDVVLFELRLAALESEQVRKFSKLSKFPQIRRDLSLLANQAITSAEIITLIRANVDESWLKEIDVFDVYSGEHIPQGKKSIGITLVLQHSDRTLVDAEINSVIHAIINSLADNYAITLRE